MTPFSCVVIGNESLLVGCADLLLERGHRIGAVITQDDDIQQWAQAKSLPCFEDLTALNDGRVDSGFDWLFSIANLRVIPQAVLALPKRGAINFHDGPLPEYAGLNTPVWALLNGARRHGITWHMIETGIDSGDILARADFDIAADETAFSLNSKCYAAAMDSFAQLVPAVETDTLVKTPQGTATRRYFAKADRPGAAGVIDFSHSANDLVQFARALDFGGYWNPLVCPKINVSGQYFAVGQIEPSDAKTDAAPGTVVSNSAAGLEVATTEGAVKIGKITDLTGRGVATDLIAIGTHLKAEPDRDESEAALRQTTHSEAKWRAALRAMTPLAAPLSKPATEAAQWAKLDLGQSLTTADIGIVLGWALISAGKQNGDLALSTQGLQNAPRAAVAPWVPVHSAQNEGLEAATARICALVEDVDAKGGFAADLIARDPQCSGADLPEFGLSLAGNAPIPGTVVTLSISGETSHLSYDVTRIDAQAAQMLADRLVAMVRAGGSHPALPSPEHDDLIKSVNQTQLDYDPTTVHGAFEAQVARTPDKTALVFEDFALSYAELNDQANALAAQLGDLGVARGAHVGVFLRRTTDLVVAAMAVMKAGGAYVPLDPAYPSDRIAHFVKDSEAAVLITQPELAGDVPEGSPPLLVLDGNHRSAQARANVDGGAGPNDLAYLIYTSGSTGMPKGVMVEHANVANFCAGMDARINQGDDAVWLAVTSLSFDISVLELFYTLSRGYKVVLGGDDNRAAVSQSAITVSDTPIDFNLFYWGNDDGAGPKKYELLLEGAKFADANGFNAVWTPERHFHAFGGPYPNPSVTGAAVAAVTQNLSVRAGSCVAPLHHPARIAEEWAVIDNLTNGRAGLAIASGWQPDDFVLRPENTPPANKPAMFESIDMLRKLWRGDSVEFPTQKGDMFAVVTQPRPVSEELPVWVTTAGNPETWREAGAIGANVLTHLLGQSIDEVGDKIKIYHAALRAAGHDPDAFTVTVMLHTYLDESREKAAEIARGPMKDYLRSAAGLIKQYAWAFPAFKRPEGATNPFEVDLAGLGDDEMEAILDFAFERYFDDSGLFGTIDDAVARTEQLKKIGVGEIACLIDYGIAPEVVLEGLKPLADVLRRVNAPTQLAADDFSLAAQVIRHKVTHLQCTPSMARIIASNDEARTALRNLRHLMLGGEALPADLVQDVRNFTRAEILNMYGPTETTIWSTTDRVAGTLSGTAPIGAPIANTSVYVLNDDLAPVATGLPGELFIAGHGVTRGYWQRRELTDERFLPDPFDTAPNARMYRTGDSVRWLPNGQIDFLGRADHQIKIRGQRIELGEIESCLAQYGGVTGAVVIARERSGGDTRLCGYVTSSTALDAKAVLAYLAQHLTEVMVPADIVSLDAFPLTPNKKIDRNALPEPTQLRAPRLAASAPADGIEAGIAKIWSQVLGVSDIRPDDNFFALGGHSLLAVQAHREIRSTLGLAKLSITDIFRFPTLSALANHVQGAPAPEPAQPSVSAPERDATMSKRRAMRAGRRERTG